MTDDAAAPCRGTPPMITWGPDESAIWGPDEIAHAKEAFASLERATPT